MTYKKKATLNGDIITYAISPIVKKFALKDIGFNDTQRGNFVLERPLDTESPYNPKVTLKIIIDSNLTGLWMKTLTSNGLHEVDIFKLPKNQGMIELFRYNMNVMIKRDILITVV